MLEYPLYMYSLKELLTNGYDSICLHYCAMCRSAGAEGSHVQGAFAKEKVKDARQVGR